MFDMRCGSWRQATGLTTLGDCRRGAAAARPEPLGWRRRRATHCGCWCPCCCWRWACSREPCHGSRRCGSLSAAGDRLDTRQAPSTPELAAMAMPTALRPKRGRVPQSLGRCSLTLWAVGAVSPRASGCDGATPALRPAVALPAGASPALQGRVAPPGFGCRVDFREAIPRARAALDPAARAGARRTRRHALDGAWPCALCWCCSGSTPPPGGPCAGCGKTWSWPADAAVLRRRPHEVAPLPTGPAAVPVRRGVRCP